MIRTLSGIILRAILLLLAPYLIGRLIGRQLMYHDLLTMEPGGTAFFIIVMTAGCLRNISRITWFFHLQRG